MLETVNLTIFTFFIILLHIPQNNCFPKMLFSLGQMEIEEIQR